MSEAKLTPLMAQYQEIKAQHLDKILFFRMGDFYEMFYDDAKVASEILNIALTSRNKNQGNDVPMCGIPHHAVGNYIKKLTSAGQKVAICEQIEDPAVAKGIVKRAVTRVVTPSMVYDSDTLESSQNNYLAGILITKNLFDVCFLDVSTGECIEGLGLSPELLVSRVVQLNPQEIIVEDLQKIKSLFPDRVFTTRSKLNSETVGDYVLRYVVETQGELLKQTLKEKTTFSPNTMTLAPQTVRGLELFKTFDNQDKGSLFNTVNWTKTPMGARLLKKRLAEPFTDAQVIQNQLDQVEVWTVKSDDRQEIRSKLSKIGDLERKTGKLSSSVCNARDIRALALAVENALQVTGLSDLVLGDLSKRILKSLREELPYSVKEGELIEKGVSKELDEYIDYSTNAQIKLSELETREKEQSGISSLKVKYNGVFGYFFEVTKTHLAKVPAHFVRKQTLAQAERFVSSELLEMEQKILSSKQKRNDLEFQIYLDLKTACLKLSKQMLKLADSVSILDLQTSFAEMSVHKKYCRASLSTSHIKIVSSRHPVVEEISRDGFVPNDIELAKAHTMLLTGPNMAGKSTLMRQVALSVILNQCGCFVPAQSAELPIVDKVFTRIGASDLLSQGLSTFMVEMTETAEILKGAGENSLVLLDEIGRGTSTYDGMSLAQALLEHFAKSKVGFSLFATHYHELTALEADLKSIINYHMAIEEHRGNLVFLRKLVKGPASRSYGIEVARLAGIPSTITARAKEILKGLVRSSEFVHSKQLVLEALPQSNLKDDVAELIEELKSKSIDNLTPLESLNILNEFKIKASQIQSLQ